MKKKIFVLFLLMSFTLGGCSSPQPASQASSTSAQAAPSLRPGDEEFTFDYEIPDNWSPKEYSENNGIKIRDMIISMDSGKGSTPVSQYYTGLENLCLYGEVPDSSFWNINPDMPKELYSLPVNMLTPKNDIGLISGKDFDALNRDRIPYYVQTAARIKLLYANCSMDDLDEFVKNALYYEGITDPENNFPNSYAGAIEGIKVKRQEAAFITDESLCYLATDGTIRVRGMCLYVMETEGATTYGRTFTEVILDLTPEKMKAKECDWQFGDFIFIQYHDLLQPEVLTEEEYLSLREQYSGKPGVPTLPDWAGIYGGK